MRARVVEHQPVGAAAREAAYIPLAHDGPDAPGGCRSTSAGLLRPWLEDTGAAKVGQNVNYDTRTSPTTASRCAAGSDTMLQSYVLGRTGRSLEAWRSATLAAAA